MTTNDSRLKDQRIAEAHPAAWSAFIEKHGMLTEIQRASFEYIYDGADTLVIAPTASGKTEAVAMPLLERYNNSRHPWKILYISPTRALVNDLYKRLEGPLDKLHIKMAKRTSDSHQNINKAQVIITTPESVDSQLCRGRSDGSDGHVFANVRAVVIDEVHLLHGTPRGEHIAWLLQRLKNLRDYAKQQNMTHTTGLQVICLSATITNPEDVEAAFLQNGITVAMPGVRPIETIKTELDTDNAILDYVSRLQHPEKILAFVNARRRAEKLSVTLQKPLEQFGYQCLVHHGSLSQTVRLDAEESMHKEDKFLVIATSTLEIGIDIGDIDLVILDGPAPDLKALLQRIGRGNRRSETTRVMLCAKSPLDSLINRAMITSARNNRIGQSIGGSHHSVALQQVVSYIYQSRDTWRSKARVKDLLMYKFSEETALEIIQNMIDNELIQERLNNQLSLSTKQVEKAEYGLIHSNITTPPSIDAIDSATGQLIATDLRPGFTDRSIVGISGRPSKVSHSTDREVFLETSHTQLPEEASWGYTSTNWFRGNDHQQSVRDLIGIEDNIWPVVTIDDQAYVFHFGGTRRRMFLNNILEIENVNDWYIKTPANNLDKPDSSSAAGYVNSHLQDDDDINYYENLLSRPRANRMLPTSLRIAEIESWLAIEEELEALRNSTWALTERPEARHKLHELIQFITSSP